MKKTAYLKISKELIPFQKAYEMQLQLVELRKKQLIPDTLWLLQHPPIYTVGRSNQSSLAKTVTVPNLLWDETTLKKYGIELHFTDRGGDITYHGPGQIVGYVIVDLNQRQNDVHKFLRDLEEIIILTLNNWNLVGERIEGKTGVWVKGAKVCAMGIRVSRWITFHGFALNVNPNLNHFQGIIPCGIQSAPVTSLSLLLQKEISVEEVIPKLVRATEEMFNWELKRVETPENYRI